MKDSYSVSEVNSYIKNMFQTDFLLSKIKVSGEVSNCKYHTSGHIYFTLKDEGGALACVMFSGDRKGLTFRLEDGMKIVASGSISIYERDGRYQLYVKNVKQDGAGVLYERYLALKESLEEMGMFDASYKQSIPKYAWKIGVVTAQTGAAIQDIINISRRRNPYVQLYLYPAKVQGEGAAATICEGIRTLDNMNMDVIIVGRGGGSIEDLWAFNEESVARAVFDCRTPVVSAVGHETDYTIIDFVADMRAPTPSAAAELTVFDYNELAERIDMYLDRIRKLMLLRHDTMRHRLDTFNMRLGYLSPVKLLDDKKKRLEMLIFGIDEAIWRRTEAERQRLKLLAGRLSALSPLAKISGGFGYIENDNGESVKSIQDIRRDDRLLIRLSDGSFHARVEDTCMGAVVTDGVVIDGQNKNVTSAKTLAR